MEVALIIVAVFIIFLLINRRFKNLIRNDFYLEKPELNYISECKVNEKVIIKYIDNKRNIAVYCNDKKIGLIPEDYSKIIIRLLSEKEYLEGKLTGVNKNGFKIKTGLKGQVRDMIN